MAACPTSPDRGLRPATTRTRSATTRAPDAADAAEEGPGRARPRPAHLPHRPALPNPLGRRAVVVGAGSFGTAVAVLLARGGFRTTLQARSTDQAEELRRERENRRYLAGVDLPQQLRIGTVEDGVGRAEFVFLGVPSARLGGVADDLERRGLGPRAKVVSLAKGLVPPDGVPPTVLLAERFGARRVGCIGGPAHAREMVHHGAGLVAASTDQEVAATIAAVFLRAGVVCEHVDDPVGVELAGAAKNAAALAAGATESQGLNAAGAAAGHIVAEVWRLARMLGAKADTFIGLAGVGDLVATALAPQSRNRQAGELLGEGVPAEQIPERIGQAVESLESVPLLVAALARHGVHAPVTTGLVELIGGQRPMQEWVELVRTTVPQPERWRPRLPERDAQRPSWWLRWRAQLPRWMGGLATDRALAVRAAVAAPPSPAGPLGAAPPLPALPAPASPVPVSPAPQPSSTPATRSTT